MIRNPVDNGYSERVEAPGRKVNVRVVLTYGFIAKHSVWFGPRLSALSLKVMVYLL